MKRFRFNLESVLRLRKLREQEALRALSVAQRARQAEVDRRAKLVVQLSEALHEREKLSAKATTIQAFHTWQHFITGQKQRIIQADHAIQKSERAVEKAMRTYLHTRQRTEAIARLKERAHEEYKKERSRWEQLQNDDLMVMRHRINEDDEGAA